jgi:chemotaxis protein CheX
LPEEPESNGWKFENNENGSWFLDVSKAYRDYRLSFDLQYNIAKSVRSLPENRMRQESVAEQEEYQIPYLEFRGQMDVVVIHALLESLFTIFSTMVRLEIKPGVPVPKQGHEARGAVSGLIGMRAEGVSGSVALSLTLPTIREISRSMLGDEIASAGNEAADLAGELTNMLVGGAKRILAERGHDFDMQTPQLLLGDGHKIVHHYSGQTVLLPINIGQDEFYIELNFI